MKKIITTVATVLLCGPALADEISSQAKAQLQAQILKDAYDGCTSTWNLRKTSPQTNELTFCYKDALHTIDPDHYPDPGDPNKPPAHKQTQ